MGRKTQAETEEFLTPYAESMGLELLEVKWTKSGGGLSLNVILDAKGGVDINTLEKFHRLIDAPLDDFDPTEGAPYTLNCSSAGLDRPFATERDYLRHIGEMVELRLYAPERGKKIHVGELVSFRDGIVEILVGEEKFDFPVNKIAKASLYIEI